MIRVRPTPMLTAAEPLDARIQVIEGHGEVPLTPTCGLQAEPRSPQYAHAYESQNLEVDERYLLRELIHRHIAGSENREAELAVDRVVPSGIGAKGLRVELAAPHHDDVCVVEAITQPYVSLLHHRYSGRRYRPQS